MKRDHAYAPVATQGGKSIRLFLGLLLSAAITLTGCGGGGAVGSTTTGTNGQTFSDADLTGFGIDGSNGGGFGSGDSGADGTGGEGGPINNGTVIITDVNGKVVRVKTNTNGYYFAKVTGFTAPLLVKIVAQNGKIYNSLHTDALAAGVINTINITALTDKVASLVAGTAGVSALTAADITAAKVTAAKQEVVSTFAAALTAAGVDASKFDPITTPFKADGTGYDKLLDQVRHEINASGSTELYSKGIAYAADGSVSSVPLSPSAPLSLSSGKELNFARLDSLRKQYTACFAQGETARSFTDSSNACGGLVHPNYKSSDGRDYLAVVEGMSGRKDRNRVVESGDVMTGAIFDAPELLLLESSSAGTSSVAATAITDLDQAIVILSWYQPVNQAHRSTSALMRRFDNTALSGGQTSNILNADGTSSNWWNYGGQGSYDYGIGARLQRFTNLNPATNVTGTGTLSAPASLSNDTSRLGLFVGTQKFNPTTRVWDDSGVAYARVTGPGLPAVGMIVSRISASSSDGICVNSIDLKHSTASVPITTETTYLGYYSSTGITPGALFTQTSVLNAIATPMPTGFLDTVINSTSTVGTTRSFYFSPNIVLAGYGPNATTTTFTVIASGAPGSLTTTITSGVIAVPPSPGTVSLSTEYLQTSATFGLYQYAISSSRPSYTYSAVTSATRPKLAISSTNVFNLGRSALDGSDFAFSASNSIYGNNNTLVPTDYAAIKPWSRYTFQLYNAAGALIATETNRLSVQPRHPQALRTMPLHDLSPSHAILTPAQAAAASLDFKWTNNIAAPTPYQTLLSSNFYDALLTTSGTVRRYSSANLKRQQLSTSGDAVKSFAASDVSQFTGCRLPATNTLVTERLDAAKTLNASNNTSTYNYREVGMHTSINRIRVTQITAWSN